MGSVDCDLEGAFTSGDPEAVLDFLAIRSQHLQHSDDDTMVSSVPIFSSDNDMAAFVRDLTIDDAISHCFADLPSTCDGTVLKSTPLPMRPSPEKKLIGTSLSTPRGHAGKRPSHTRRRSGGARQSPPPSVLPRSSSTKSKARGFLSSLLSRGYRQRKEIDQQKSCHHQGTKPAVPPADELNDSEILSVSCEHVALDRLGGNSACPATTDVWLHDLEDWQQSLPGSAGIHDPDLEQSDSEQEMLPEAQHVEVVTVHKADSVSLVGSSSLQTHASITGNLDNSLDRLLSDKGSVLATKSHSSDRQVNNDHTLSKRHSETDSAVSKQQTETKLCSPLKHGGKATDFLTGASVHRVSNTHTHTGKSLPSNVHGTASARSVSDGCRVVPSLHSGEQHKHSSKTPLINDDRSNHISEDSHRSLTANVASNNGQSTEQRQSYRQDHNESARAILDGWCDGIDSFIDFERDPNLEVPLDSTLTAQFDFKRRSSVDSLQDSSGTYETLTNKFSHSEISAPSSQTPHRSSQSMSSAAGVKAPDEKNDPEASVKNVTSCSESALVSSLVSTGTQTEQQMTMQTDTGWTEKIDHCLHTAITQLSALALCSPCKDKVSRTLNELQRMMKEIADDCDSYDVTKTSFDVTPTVEFKSDSGITVSVDPSVHQAKQQTANPYSTDTVAERRQEHRTPHNLAVVVTKHKLSKNKAQQLQPDEEYPWPHGHQPDAVLSPPTSASTRPASELPATRFMSNTSDVLISPQTAAASADSDGDSTSTVTSEPTTVLVCQRGNRSSGKSPDVEAQLSDKVSHSCHDRDAGGCVVDEENAACKSDGVSHNENVSSPKDPAETEFLSSPRTGKKSAKAVITSTKTGSSSPHYGSHCLSRYAGEREAGSESFITSSWSEMTSVSSVSDVTTSADESSYYSGDDDNDYDDEDDDDEDDDDNVTTMVRLGLLDEDRDDSELRQHRLQRHLAAVLRQNTVPAAAVETVVAATGERLNGQEQQHQACHINQGTLYSFSSSAHVSIPSGEVPLLSACGTERQSVESARLGSGENASALSPHRDARSFSKKKGGATPRLFSPDRQASLVSARQMTSEEFREGYDRSSDITKLKRSQLDGDVPWDLIQCSDTDEDAGSDKAWYNVTSEEEGLPHAYGSDTDSSTATSDW